VGNSIGLVRRAHAQSIPVEDLDDFSGQDRLKLFNIRVLTSQIPEYVSASARDFQRFLFHQSLSFSFFNRSLISSISRLGVLMPCVDFF